MTYPILTPAEYYYHLRTIRHLAPPRAAARVTGTPAFIELGLSEDQALDYLIGAERGATLWADMVRDIEERRAFAYRDGTMAMRGQGI